MILKRLLLAILTLVNCVAFTYSQNPYFGLKGGVNISKMVLKDDSGQQSKLLNYSPGFNAGVTMDYRIIPEVTVNASLLITQKGYSERKVEDFQGETIKSLEALQLYYVELPIYAKHEMDLGALDVFVGAGGFVGYGYWGKYRWRREGGGEIEWGKGDVYWGDDPDLHDFQYWDYGVSVNGGIKFENFVLDFGYNYSLPNIASNTDNGQVARNRVLYASFNYFFSRFYKYQEGNY